MIDVHTHVVPAELPFGAKGDDRWPVLEFSGATAKVLIRGSVFRAITSQNWDLGRRLEDMARDGVVTQVLSPMPELFSYWAEPDPAARYCAAMNNWIAEAVRSHPGSFEGLGIVPLQAPDVAGEMLADVRSQGLRGVEIGTNVNGMPLHDRRLEPFFTEAERLGLAVFVHAFHPPRFETLTSPMAANAVTFPLEIGFAIGGLIAEGVVGRCPGLRLCASHGGGALSMIIPRLSFMWANDAAIREKAPERPDVYARRLFYDLLVFSAPPCASSSGPLAGTSWSSGPTIPSCPNSRERSSTTCRSST